MSDCIFCKIPNSGSHMLKDAKLYWDSDFYIVPALGCIVPGYVMLVSKRHANSMRSFGKDTRDNIKKAIEKLSDLYMRKYGFYPVIFEHGSAENDTSSGASITHAHMHIVPCKFNLMAEMQKQLELEEVSAIDAMIAESSNHSYMLFINNDRKTYMNIAPKKKYPSQIMRQWIARNENISTEWDWKRFPFYENILNTIIDIGTQLRSFRYTDNYLSFNSVYYCRAMDGLNDVEIKSEYDTVGKLLAENGLTLVNPYNHHPESNLSEKEIGALLASENSEGINKSDCVIVNLSIKGHPYMGCIDEMINANMKGKYVITIVGDSGYEKKRYTHFRSDKIVKTVDEAFDFVLKHKSSL